jgi:hypothetical protein
MKKLKKVVDLEKVAKILEISVSQLLSAMSVTIPEHIPSISSADVMTEHKQ